MAILNNTVINGSLNVNGNLYIDGVTETITNKDDNTTITQRASLNKVIPDLSEKMRQIWDIPGYYFATSSKNLFACYRVGPLVCLTMHTISSFKDYIKDTIPYGWRPFSDTYESLNCTNSGYVTNYGRIDIVYSTGAVNMTFYNYSGTEVELYNTIYYFTGDRYPSETAYKDWNYKDRNNS